MRRLLLFVGLLVISFNINAQNFSNKGKDFWVGYGFHQAMTSGNAQQMVLYFTSDVTANVKVEIPGIGWVKNYTVAANTVTVSDVIPKSNGQDARLNREGISNNGIHITADQPIVAYAHIYNSSVSGASLLFPVNTLGKDYYSLNFTQKSNSDSSLSWAYVVATEDSTTVEITPSGNTFYHNAGVPFTVSLSRGQVFNIFGEVLSDSTGVDLTGTRIRSISSGSSSCKRIAVFSGTGRISIGCDPAVTPTSDNFIQQIFPRSAWGRKFLTVSTADLTNNFFRIAVSDPTTIVKVNGVQLTNLIKNFYYEISAGSPQSIVTDKPVMVAQYITSTNTSTGPTCGNSTGSSGDPEMIYISPTEQTIDQITLYSTDKFKITTHYINVVVKTSAKGSFILDNINKGTSFTPHPQDPSYSYAVFSVSPGPHNLKADSGFNAIAYGYGQFESYGYNAGTNIKDLYQYITIQTPYATLNTPATCVNTDFHFSVTLPYMAAAFTWDFGNNSNVTPNQNITENNPVPDSSFIRDGRTMYVYKLTSQYKFTAAGTFPVKIITTNQLSDGCNGQSELLFDIIVVPAMTANFIINHTGCISDSVRFLNSSSGSGYPITNNSWDFGNGTTDSTKNPVRLFTSSGNYNVKLKVINTIGCAAEIIKPFTVAPQPTANFIVPGSACEKIAATFTDASTIPSGAISKWRWSFGPGDSVINNTNASVTKVFSTAGTYTVSLQVENAGGCKSLAVAKTITVNPSPVVKFSVPKICVNDPYALFVDSSFMPGGSAANLTYTWNFGDPNATASNSNTATGKFNGKHKYNAAGDYNVSLTVTNQSAGCSSTLIRKFTVNGRSPVAAFSLNAIGPLCGNAPVEIVNHSTIDTGSITRLEIIWDYINNPSAITSEDDPLSGTTYSNIYTASATVQKYIIMVKAYSGQTCASQKIDSVTVQPAPQVSFSSIADFCLNDKGRIITEAHETTGVQPGAPAIFSGKGITADGYFDPSLAGEGNIIIQYLFTSANGCKDSAQQTIKVNPVPVIKLPQQLYVLEGSSATITPIVTGIVTKYSWSPATYLNNPAIATPLVTPKTDIRYKLMVENNYLCSDTADIKVIVLTAPKIPSAFSPNADGINDVWNIASLSAYTGCTVEVFNRFGQQVFNSIGYSKPWDGTYKGTPLPAGVYYYIIEPKNGRNTITGNVTIIR